MRDLIKKGSYIIGGECPGTFGPAKHERKIDRRDVYFGESGGPVLLTKRAPSSLPDLTPLKARLADLERRTKATLAALRKARGA